MANQGKLLTEFNTWYVGVLRAYLAWSIETYVSKLSNIKIHFYLFIVILCAKISSVYRPLILLNLRTFLKTELTFLSRDLLMAITNNSCMFGAGSLFHHFVFAVNTTYI